MAEADSLRMVAEVVDKFSGPLRALRSHLQSMSRDGAAHAEVVQKGMQRVEGAARSAGQATGTVLNPALAAVGVTGLGVVAALTGVGTALRSFGGSVSSLAMLGRETGVAADQLRVIQGVMGRFGIEADASGAAIKTFAQNMRLARDGIGPIMEFLRTQGRTAEGRRYFNDLADSLRNTKDNGEALTKALEALENIQDPAGRATFAERILGNADLGRLGDKHLGPIRKLREEIAKSLGPLDPATVQAAEQFDRSMGQLQTTMKKLGTAIATEAMPHVTEFVRGMESLVKGGREDVTGPLREGVREIGTALSAIDWKAAKEDATDFLKGTAEGAKGLVEAVREIAAILRSLNEGKYLDAARRVDGASGPLARRLAPQVGDDEIDAQERVDRLRKLRDISKEAGQYAIGRAQQRLGLLDNPEKVARDLAEAEAKLNALRGRSAAERRRDFERGQAPDPARDVQARLQASQAELAYQQRRYPVRDEARERELTDEIAKLTIEMKRLREAQKDGKREGEATVQQQSFDGTVAGFDPSLIQKASFGVGNSMARVGNVLRQSQERGLGINVPDGPLRSGRVEVPDVRIPRMEVPEVQVPDGPLRSGRLQAPEFRVPRMETPEVRVPNGPLRSGRLDAPELREFTERLPPQMRDVLRGMPGLGSGQGGGRGMPDILGQIMPQVRPFLRGQGPEARGRARPWGRYERDGGERSGGPRGGSGRPDAQPDVDTRSDVERRNFGGGRFNGLGGMVPRVQPRAGGPGERVGRWQRGEQNEQGRLNARQPDRPGQYRPEYQLGDADLDQKVVNTIAGEVSTRSAEGVDAVINNMMNRVGSKKWGPSDNLLEVARAPGQYAGYRRANPSESEFVRSRIRAIASGGVPDNTAGSNSYRAESYYRQTQGRGKGYWADRATIGPNVGGNRYAFEPGIPNGPYAPFDPNAIKTAKPAAPRETADGGAWDARRKFDAGGARPGEMRMRNDESFSTLRQSLRGLRTDRGEFSNAANALKGLSERRSEGRGLGGEAFAESLRGIKAQSQRTDLMPQLEGGAGILNKAVRSGMAGATPRVDANGSVNIRVEKPGPDTRVRTSAAGNLFKEVRMSRGRAMPEASQDN